MLLVHREVAVSLPAGWLITKADPNIGLGPVVGSKRPTLVIMAEPAEEAYEAIGEFAKRTFRNLQRALSNFTVVDERIVNTSFPMFRLEYAMLASGPDTVKLRQIQYYIRQADQFYSLTFTDINERHKSISTLAAVMIASVRVLRTPNAAAP